MLSELYEMYGAGFIALGIILLVTTVSMLYAFIDGLLLCSLITLGAWIITFVLIIILSV